MITGKNIEITDTHTHRRNFQEGKSGRYFRSFLQLRSHAFADDAFNPFPVFQVERTIPPCTAELLKCGLFFFRCLQLGFYQPDKVQRDGVRHRSTARKHAVIELDDAVEAGGRIVCMQIMKRQTPEFIVHF